MKICKHILLIIMLLYAFETIAQEVVQKVSKPENKRFDQKIDKLLVMGEKASITVVGWSNNYISVKLTPISRNANKSIAITDLKFIKYSASIENNQLVVKNSFEGENEKISSNLSIEIEISVPNATPVVVKNLYGTVKLMSLTHVNTEVSFGKIILDKISGNSTIHSRYSDITLNDILGTINITAEKATIEATSIDATTKIESQYGKIVFDARSNHQSIQIKSQRTEAIITVDNFKRFNYKLSTTFAKIKIPDKDLGKELNYSMLYADKNKLIEIITTYCDITITNK